MSNGHSRISDEVDCDITHEVLDSAAILALSAPLAPFVPAVKARQPIEYLVKPISDVRPHRTVCLRRASGTQCGCQFGMKARRKCLPMGGDIVKPIEDKNLFFLYRISQA